MEKPSVFYAFITFITHLPFRKLQAAYNPFPPPISPYSYNLAKEGRERNWSKVLQQASMAKGGPETEAESIYSSPIS